MEQYPDDIEPIKLVIVDQSKDALDAARDQADRRLDQELGEGGKFHRFLDGIWKGNLAKDFYRQKYTSEAQTEIGLAQDVLLYDAPEDRRGQAIEATIERFQNDVEGSIHTEAGESREVQEGDTELTVGMKDLIRRYCSGELNDETLPEERTRLLNAYQETHGVSGVDRSLVTVDNLLETAQAVAGAIEHGESLDDTLDNMQVISGEARDGARSEASYNAVDRVIDKLARSKVGSLVGPEVVAAAVTIAASVARVGSHSVVGAATKTILPGVGAGLWAGLRENKRMKDERSQHSREMAQGKEFEDGAKRRTEIEETRYESITAVDLTEHLRSIGSEDVLNEGGNEAIQAAIDALAAINTRVLTSDSRKIDLITFTDPASVGSERMALDIARAEVKVALESRLSDEVRTSLGFENGANLHDILEAQSVSYIEAIEGDMSAKDQAFNKLKRRNVAKATAIGVVTGITIGMLSQELMAAADPTRAGLLEQLWGAKNTAIDGAEHQTILHGLIAGDHTTVHTGPSGDYTSQSFGKNSELSVSSEHSIVNNGNGTLSLLDANGHASAENIAINPDGSLPQGSIDQLSKLGMVVNNKSFDTEVVTSHAEKVSAHDFVKNHLAETTRVKRELWYDNNTSAPIYDKNELGLHWGVNNGVTKDGFQLSVKTMTSDGSFHDSHSVDWAEAARDGHLKLAVSGTGDTQNQVFMVKIDEHGRIDIPEGSPASKFFSNENGHAQFNGRYAEVVQVTGDSKGVEHIRPLATLVGDKHPGSVVDQVSKTVIEHHNAYEITTNGYDTVQENFTEMAPVIPIASRRSMETVGARYEKGYYYQGGEYLSPDEVIVRREETSPRLLENPDEKLVPAREFSWYKSLLRKKRGNEYVSSIEHIIEGSPELSTINSDIKAIITIPVNAAGNAESESIYDVLAKAYGSQDKEALDSTLVLLHVNWFDSYEGDDTAMQGNIARTKEAIQRAKIDFPQLRIATIETEWKRSEVQGGVIGHVSRKLNDVTLLALEAATSSGRMEADSDVLLIRNDADPKGVSASYLKRYLDSFNNNPGTDIFTGTTSFDNTKASRLPGFVFAANFMMSLDLLSASRESSVHTGGANFGVRASTFAAVGAVGFDDSDTGAGSDDVLVGRRVGGARKGTLSRSRKKKSYNQRSYHQTKANSPDKPKRRVAIRVLGARIDTDSDRGEELYGMGVPIVHQWDSEFDFNKNGYKPRNAGLGDSLEESMPNDPDTVIERIRNDIEGSINMMGASSSVVRSALVFTFPGLGGRGYSLNRRSRGGGYSLALTPEGIEYLVNHLTRDSRGRYDPYGTRKMRQMYGETQKPDDQRPLRRPMIRV